MTVGPSSIAVLLAKHLQRRLYRINSYLRTPPWRSKLGPFSLIKKIFNYYIRSLQITTDHYSWSYFTSKKKNVRSYSYYLQFSNWFAWKDEWEDYFIALKESIQQLTSTNRVDKKFQMSFSIINIFLLWEMWKSSKVRLD